MSELSHQRSYDGLRLPDWIGLGGQRSGTNWMIANLYEHPQIYAASYEVHYFHKSEGYDKGPEWYCRHWENAASEQLVGECSSAYLYSEIALRRIESDCPKVRLLVSIRNPIERSRSAFRLAIQGGRIPASTTFREAVRDNPEILENSRYGKYLKKYIDTFGRDRIHINMMDFDNVENLRRLYSFLGIDPSYRSRFATRVIGKAYVPKSVALDRSIIATADWMRQHGLGSIHWMIKSTGLPVLIRRMNDRTDKVSTADLKPDDVAFLTDELGGDIDNLQRLTGLDLKELWLKPYGHTSF